MSSFVRRFNFGSFTLFSILDQPSLMSVDLFSGPLTREQRLTLMPQGHLPATVNVFLLAGPCGHILIDAGWGDQGLLKSRFSEGFESLGLKADDIDAVVLTHMHPDHICGLLEGGQAALPKAEIMVARQELEFWQVLIENEGKTAESEALGQPFAHNLVQKVIEAYPGRLKTIEFGQEIRPGLTAEAAAGHTPGHSLLRLKAPGVAQLLLAGDILHAAGLQFPWPEECATYDYDPAAAVESRKRILNLAAEENMALAGTHIPFPGVGRLSTNGGRGFVFTPLNGEEIK